MPKQTTFPQWKGFEFSPQGCLLEQVIDISGDMGVAYERSCEFYKDFHTHDRLMLIFPRGSSAMEVRTQSPRQTYFVDANSVLTVPKDLNHDDEGKTSIYDTMALYPSVEMIQACMKRLGLPASAHTQLTSECLKVKRSKRLEHDVHEYFFERILNKKSAADEDTAYLARRILEETLRLLFVPAKKSEAAAGENVNDETVLVRALRFIETNLFEDLELELIAKHSGASVSTLLRRFKEEAGTTPYAYVKNRRLEEARRLLAASNRPVSEVAVLVGYENFGAFSEAFKSKYGHSPSLVVGKREA